MADRVTLAPGVRWFVVEDAFAIQSRGLVLVPPLPVEEARRGAVRVTLVRPDGTTQEAGGRVCVEMFSPPRPPSSVLVLDGLPREAAPAGTIVYLLDDPAGA